jgi:AcrR family transcriptional regulator
MLPPQSGYERRKDPQKVRAALIDATVAMIAEQGLARVTVDAVAKAAGVTKGGLFHHFPSKQALIDGVLDMMMDDADAKLDRLMAADPDPQGRFTRALLTGLLSEDIEDEGAPSRTLCLSMLADPSLQQRWAGWVAGRVERHAATDDNPRCAIVRLATDGLWLLSVFGDGAPPPISDAVRDELIAMTRTCT